jgi:hypothetical protein
MRKCRNKPNVFNFDEDLGNPVSILYLKKEVFLKLYTEKSI